MDQAWGELRRGLDREGRVLARRYGSDREARVAWERLQAYVGEREEIAANVVRLAEPPRMVAAACPDSANADAMTAAPWGRGREQLLDPELADLLLDRLATVLLELAGASRAIRPTRSVRMPAGAEVEPGGRLSARVRRG